MSPSSRVAFLALVATVVAALLVGVWWSGRDLASNRRTMLVTVVSLAAWLGGTAALALSGALDALEVVPPPALFVLVTTVVLTVALAMSPLGRRLALGVPLPALVGVQVFRVPLEVLLHRLHLEGVLPVEVTYQGWNYDIATGALALVLAVALWRGPVPRWVVSGWNGLGLILVTVVVATAVLALPTPFQQIQSNPSAEAIVTTVPLIWLPTVLVAGAIIGHVLVARRLRADLEVGRGE